MPVFSCEVEREVTEIATFEVEADSIEEAEKLAERKARKLSSSNWEEIETRYILQDVSEN